MATPQTKMATQSTLLLDAISELLSPLTQKIDVLNIKVGNIESTIGNLYESSMRKEIINRHGQRYAQTFNDESLFGLARISFPKRSFLNLPNQYSQLDESQILQRHVEALSDEIFSKRLYENAEKSLIKESKNILGRDSFEAEVTLGNLKALGKDQIDDDTHAEMLKEISKEIETSMTPQQKRKKTLRTCKEGLIKLAEFYKEHDGPTRKKLLQSNSRVGILCITSFLHKPKLSLEFDCRGQVEIIGNTAMIEIGEIKKDIHTGRSKAKSQLNIRLRTMEFALKVIAASYELKIDNVIKVGRIFHPTKHHKDDREEQDQIHYVEEFVI